MNAPIPKMRAGTNEMGARIRQIGAFMDEKGVSIHETLRASAGWARAS